MQISERCTFDPIPKELTYLEQVTEISGGITSGTTKLSGLSPEHQTAKTASKDH